MGEFGWANVDTAQSKGVSGSIQYKAGDTPNITGSSKFTYDETTGLVVTGNVAISGTLSANEYRVNVVEETITQLNSQGSTKFGNTGDDQHIFTGSVYLSAASDSGLVFQLSTAGFNALTPANRTKVTTVGSDYFLSSSNSDQRGLLNSTVTIGGVEKTLSEETTFFKATNPALVVSGATVLKDPLSIQGGVYGASPVNVYAPLLFRRDDLGDTEVPDEEMKIEKGKFVGNLILSSSNDNHGLFIQGAGRIVMNSLQNISGTNASNAEPAPEILMANS